MRDRYIAIVVVVVRGGGVVGGVVGVAGVVGVVVVSTVVIVVCGFDRKHVDVAVGSGMVGFVVAVFLLVPTPRLRSHLYCCC